MSKGPRKHIRPIRKAAPAQPKAQARGPAQTKLDKMVRAMSAPKGATIPDLMRITGWQVHSVRGAISGALKKKRGLAIIADKLGSERTYRLPAPMRTALCARPIRRRSTTSVADASWMKRNAIA